MDQSLTRRTENPTRASTTASIDWADKAQAWSAFWQSEGPDSRCLAGASTDLHQALGDHWRSFARALALQGKVLDIGCGGGIVGRSLVAAQPHLQVIGIDLARIPRTLDSRIEILSATPMESLPFANASFSAAVSQFGFEYGQIDEAAKELARVLVADAPFSFLVHHSQSSIVAGDRVQKRVMRHLIGEELKTAFLSGSASALDRQISFFRRLYPGELIIKVTAQGLRSHITRGPAERARIWEAVVDALAPELTLIGALEQCCVAPEEIDRWLAPLRDWFEIRPPSALRISTGEPVAWKVEGVRKNGRG